MTDRSTEPEAPIPDAAWVASLIAERPGKTYAVEGGEDPLVTASRDVVTAAVHEILAEIEQAGSGDAAGSV